MSDAGPNLTISEAAWLRVPATQQVFAALNQKGHVARVVGGCVRNSLFAQAAGGAHDGGETTDVDFATTATPEETMELAAAAGLRTVPTGLKHGTVTVIAGGEGFEVTTLRHDVSTDGRHAEVAFTDDWAVDAARRDLTINALYADADGTIFDPLGGLDDLNHRRIRFVGEPTLRIREDFLRILRFFRFHAQYGDGQPDAAGLRACVAERAGLARLSAERVHQELMKLLVSPGAVATLQIMLEYGVLGEILPVVANISRLDRLVDIDPMSDGALRLAALCVLVDEDASRLDRRLRLSRQETSILRLAAQSQEVKAALPLNDRIARKLLYHYGPADYIRLLTFQRASNITAFGVDEWVRFAQLPEHWAVPSLPISGQDLIERGLAPGKTMGIVLRDLEQRWIQSDFKRNRRSLLADAEELIAAAGK